MYTIFQRGWPPWSRLLLVALTLSVHKSVLASDCPLPFWPSTLPCSGHGQCVLSLQNISNSSLNISNATQDQSWRCKCDKGYRGLTYGVDFGSFDCVSHVTSSVALIWIALIVCSIAFSLSAKLEGFRWRWADMNFTQKDTVLNIFWIVMALVFFALLAADIVPSRSLASAIFFMLANTCSLMSGTIHNLEIIWIISAQIAPKLYRSWKIISWVSFSFEAVFLALFAILIPLAPAFTSTSDPLKAISLQRLFMSLFFVTLLVSMAIYGTICYIYIRQLIEAVKAAPKTQYLTKRRRERFLILLNSTFVSSSLPVPINLVILTPILFYPVLFNYLIPVAFFVAALASTLRPLNYIRLRKDDQDFKSDTTNQIDESLTATKRSSSDNSAITPSFQARTEGESSQTSSV